MINYSNLYRLYDLLGEMIFYGFRNHFSSEYIEESVSSSIIFREYLDKGDDSFINNLSLKEIFQGTYDIEIAGEDLQQINTICMWLGEAYLRLYFKYHKTTAFLFVYFPLDKMTNMFGVYHEMDWTQLYQYFEDETEKKSLLLALLKKRRITAYGLSVLTGIKYQTIINYTRKNRYIYNASFGNVSKISAVLNVENSIFLEEINNYIDASYLDLEIKNIGYLTNYGYHVISFFDKNIGSQTFEYDGKLQISKSGNHILKTLIPSSPDIAQINDAIKKYQDRCPYNFKDVFLIVFVGDDIEKPSIMENDFKKIFIITPQYLFEIENERTKKKTISRTLHQAAMRLSKPDESI